jgi:hypothetical protein
MGAAPASAGVAPGAVDAPVFGTFACGYNSLEMMLPFVAAWSWADAVVAAISAFAAPVFVEYKTCSF